MRWLLVLLTIFVDISTSHAQDLCSCTPLVYKWRLDFDLFCPPANVTSDETNAENAGIRDVFCQIVSGGGSNTTDFKPISIISYQIIELSQNLTPIKVNNRDNINLTDGDIITFNSITAVQPEEISGGLQASVNAINMNLEPIRLEWLVRYSNICEKLPYEFGNSVGWMVYESGPLSRPYTCFPSSIIPSGSPTSVPSEGPSLDFTARPSEKPSLRDSNPPSRLPTTQPSRIPSDGPTKSMSVSPNVQPAREPSAIPTREPSAIPSTSFEPSNFPSEFSMSMSYDLSMSMKFDVLVDTREGRYFLDRYTTEFGSVKKRTKKEKKTSKMI